MQISEIISEIKDKEPGNIILSQDTFFIHPDGYLWIQTPPVYQKFIFGGDFFSIHSRICSTAGFQYIPQFALYPSVNRVKERDAKIINLFEVIRMMRGPALKEKARQIREAKEIGDEAKRSELKASLPYITHSGIYIPRCNSGLTLPGFTYQLDIDKIPNPKEILQKVIEDKELIVLFATIGASGNGVKAMLFLKDLLFLRDSWTAEQYSKAYHQVTDILSGYFQDKYHVRIDTQTKAISQPFYLFYSPDLYVHKNLSQWV